MLLVGSIGAKLSELKVLEHTLYFDETGWADGSALTDAEVERLRRFHFHIRHVQEPIVAVSPSIAPEEVPLEHVEISIPEVPMIEESEIFAEPLIELEDADVNAADDVDINSELVIEQLPDAKESNSSVKVKRTPKNKKVSS